MVETRGSEKEPRVSEKGGVHGHWVVAWVNGGLKPEVHCNCPSEYGHQSQNMDLELCDSQESSQDTHVYAKERVRVRTDWEARRSERVSAGQP